ncbi:hypothetical protein RCE24_22595 [Klebsiella variicola subsp. variicola]|uniref:hypothetical protein n=1 Tax=Klebsiella variicola TaxID=244366 RepID=UPI0027E104EA|nr:hypothetical protein [Klebsiella variicola]MDQ5183831.1 hypothetical protein [Klebsiella variicola subsp. variicola]MDQ5271712.1 hypothetical protein [Klebsiella variicola subsp. variicola]
MTSKITREQLIEKLKHRILVTEKYPDVEEAQLDAIICKIALAALTAPDDVPRLVMDRICDMSDGGVDAQGIWELCKAEITGEID